MTRNRPIIFIGAIAVAAFAAGRLTLIGAVDPALASEPQVEPQLTASMQACIEAGLPGENHRFLDRLAGDWDMTVKMWESSGAEPMEVTAKVHREWVLEQRYLRESVVSESDWGRFEGTGYLGYNNLEGQYQSIWLDNMSTAIVSATGSYDPDRKVITFRSTQRDPLTRAARYSQSTFDISNPDRNLYVEFTIGPDGREFKSFEGIADRRH